MKASQGKRMRATPASAAWVLLVLVTGALAYDLTPDRGIISQTLNSNTPYVNFHVWNVGINDWGPTNNCGTVWGDAQWRGEDGHRIGSVVSKMVALQYDFNPLTNGWFTPNPKRTNSSGCMGSEISRGWDDEYTNQIPSASGIGTSTKPTLLLRLDPARVNSADENLDNNQVWITTQWNASVNGFTPVENLTLSAGSVTLSASDSLLFGAYSTNSANGNITITNQTRSTTLVHGNEKVGYQGRRMTVTLTGGAQNTYTIQNGSMVRAEFLGQNTY
jgi:hypothetical protein